MKVLWEALPTRRASPQSLRLPTLVHPQRKHPLKRPLSLRSSSWRPTGSFTTANAKSPLRKAMWQPGWVRPKSKPIELNSTLDFAHFLHAALFDYTAETSFFKPRSFATTLSKTRASSMMSMAWSTSRALPQLLKSLQKSQRLAPLQRNNPAN